MEKQPHFGLTGGRLTTWITVCCGTAMTLFGYDQGVFSTSCRIISGLTCRHHTLTFISFSNRWYPNLRGLLADNGQSGRKHARHDHLSVRRWMFLWCNFWLLPGRKVRAQELHDCRYHCHDDRSCTADQCLFSSSHDRRSACRGTWKWTEYCHCSCVAKRDEQAQLERKAHRARSGAKRWRVLSIELGRLRICLLVRRHLVEASTCITACFRHRYSGNSSMVTGVSKVSVQSYTLDSRPRLLSFMFVIGDISNHSCNPLGGSLPKIDQKKL